MKDELSSNKKLNVFITIDTEVWTYYNNIYDNIDSSIYGIIDNKYYGLPYQLNIFHEYGIKANFFVEPFFSLCLNIKYLNSIISLIKKYDQDVCLHIHTEWLSRCENNFSINDKSKQNVKDYDCNDQKIIINEGVELFKKCGVRDIPAFRAGNYGGNLDMLNALYENSIIFDTTYNYCYLNSLCDMQSLDILVQPIIINNVVEFPITFFSDFPYHYRHLQLTACSFDEIKKVLESSWKNGLYSCVIVLHSFEWIKRIDRFGVRRHKLDNTVLNRFLKLCEFLSNNSDKYETVKFSDIDTKDIPKNIQFEVIKSNYYYTIIRYIQQIYRRVQW